VSLGDYLRFYSDSAVIAAVLNVSLVTPFNVATRLIECFRSIVVAAGGPVFGAMTELDGGRRQHELQELLVRSTRFLALLSILGGVLLIVDGGPLLRLWVGDGMMSAYPVIAVLAFGYMINLAQHPMLLIVIAKGQHGPLGWWSIAEGVVNIVLSVFWGMSHGLLGVAMGTIVPMLVMKLIIQPWYALKASEMSVWEYLHRGLGRPVVVGVLFAAVAGRLFVSTEITASLFVASLALQVMIFVALTWFLALTKTERLWVSNFARRRLSWPLVRHSVINPGTEADLRGQE
jgi:O-antigen/teichoic acid export membrane protein